MNMAPELTPERQKKFAAQLGDVRLGDGEWTLRDMMVYSLMNINSVTASAALSHADVLLNQIASNIYECLILPPEMLKR